MNKALFTVAIKVFPDLFCLIIGVSNLDLWFNSSPLPNHFRFEQRQAALVNVICDKLVSEHPLLQAFLL